MAPAHTKRHSPPAATRRIAAAPVKRLTTADAKLLSFAYSASGVSWNRFCNLWLLKCGFTPREVGLMKSMSLAGKFCAQPLWAGSADVGAPAGVLALSVVASVATLEGLRRGTRAGFLMRHTTGEHQPLEGVALLRVLRSAASAASPVADAMVLALAREGGEAWGRQRFWGSASWGLGSLAVGALIDRVGLEAGLFGSSYAVSLALLFLLAWRILPRWPRDDDAAAADAAGDSEAPPPPATVPPSPGHSKKRAPRNLGAVVSHGVVALRRSAALRLALANAALYGTLVVVVDSILYMQLENELEVSRTTNGLATTVATFATFPWFWHSSHLIRRFGHWRVLLWSQAVLPFRLLLHAGVDASNVRWLLPLAQLLNGPMFAAWLSAAVELVDRLAPAELRASSQSLLTMAYFTLGGCVGNLVWSAAFDAWGGRATYLVAAACAAAACCLCALLAAPLMAERTKLRSRSDDDVRMPYPLVDDEVALNSRQP